MFDSNWAVMVGLDPTGDPYTGQSPSLNDYLSDGSLRPNNSQSGISGALLTTVAGSELALQAKIVTSPGLIYSIMLYQEASEYIRVTISYLNPTTDNYYFEVCADSVLTFASGTRPNTQPYVRIWSLDGNARVKNSSTPDFSYAVYDQSVALINTAATYNPVVEANSVYGGNTDVSYLSEFWAADFTVIPHIVQVFTV